MAIPHPGEVRARILLYRRREAVERGSWDSRSTAMTYPTKRYQSSGPARAPSINERQSMATTHQPVTLLVNRTRHPIMLEPRRTLLDALRHDLGLTGTKKVCDVGTCGACTVIV